MSDAVPGRKGVPQTLSEDIDAYLSSYEDQGFFSGSVLVAQGGELVLSKGYGMANRELLVPNTPSTKFRLASLTKAFTAAAVLLLQQKQLLDVGDPVSQYVPAFPYGDRITLHHLLSHTSGIPRPSGISETKRWTTADLIAAFCPDKPLLFPPGERFQYGNANYVLLSYIIEMVSGMRYEEFLRTSLFRPLGMNDTGYDVQSEIVANRASGYSAFENRWVNGRLQDMSAYSGAAGLYSTVQDLYRWDQAMEQLLNARSREAMFTAYLGNYGYGWYIDQWPLASTTRKRIHHGGLNDGGFFTRMTRYPEQQALVITLSNYLLSPLERIHQDLAALLFGESFSKPVFVSPGTRFAEGVDLNPYVGTYEAFVPFEIIERGGRLFLVMFGFRLELFPVLTAGDPDRFQAGVADVWIHFQKNASGEVTAATLSWLGEDECEASKRP